MADPVNLSSEESKGFIEQLSDLVLGSSAEGVAMDEAKEYVDGVKGTGASDDDTSNQFLDLDKCFSEKQRLQEQCLLLEHLSLLAPLHANIADYDKIHLLEGESYQIIDKLFLKPYAKNFFEIAPHQLAELTPYVRLYKIHYPSENSDPVDIEMKFEDHSFIDPKEALGDVFERGSGVGFKSFDWEYVGTNPVSAPNDIRASLVLSFQDMKSLFETREDGKGNKYQYSDLIVANNIFESDKGADRQAFNPQYYQIKIVVGWSFEKTDGAQITDPDLIKGIENSKLTLFLDKIDTEFDFRQDGTFHLKASFIAALDAHLASNDADILFSKNLRDRRNEREQMIKQLKLDCQLAEAQKLQDAYEADSERERAIAYESIIKELMIKNLIYHADITKDQLAAYPDKGISGLKTPIITALDASQTPLASNVSRRINYFFFGDLLDILYERLYYDKEGANKLKNSRLVLGTIDFFDRLSKSQNRIRISLADIPITVESFNVFFTNQVTAKKLYVYPLLGFIKDAAKYLVLDALGSDCFGSFAFKYGALNTTNITLPMVDGLDPLLAWQSSFNSANGRIDVARITADEPLAGVNYKDIKDSYHYFILYVDDKPPLTYTGDYDDDFKNGVYHLHFGTNRGIVKKIKFKKTDIVGLREARFENEGVEQYSRTDPKISSQLSNVYNVDLNLIGNNFFFPGTHVFINPIGLGPSLGSPTSAGSNAYIMGLGGYHMVTKVKSFIQSGKYETQITALWQSSGAKADIHNQFISKESDCKTDTSEPAQAVTSDTSTPSSTISTDFAGSTILENGTKGYAQQYSAASRKPKE